jgi:hypothetical protein
MDWLACFIQLVSGIPGWHVLSSLLAEFVQDTYQLMQLAKVSDLLEKIIKIRAIWGAEKSIL